MQDHTWLEWEGIRDEQSALRQRLDALDIRVARLEPSREPKMRVIPPELPRFFSPGPMDTPKAAIEQVEPPKPEEVGGGSPETVTPEVNPSTFIPPPEVREVVDSIPQIPPQEQSQRAHEGERTFELEFGRVWLVRIGIVVLLTGLVFLGNFAWTEFLSKLGAAGKLTLIYLAGAGLAGLGWWVKQRWESVATYGKVLIGGGIATVYYATYAAHYVDRLRVIESPLLAGLLLMGLAGGIVWLADRLRSEAVAAVTVLLGFYTAAINPLAGFSLFSNLVLSAIAIVLLVKRRWLTVSFLALVGCYAAFGFWRLQNGTLFDFTREGATTFWTAFLFPACYWLVFTVATFLGHAETFRSGTRPAFLTINNGAFFGLTAPVVAWTHPQEFWLYTVGYGAVLLALSALAARRESGERSFDGAYLTQGLGLVTLGIVFHFSGYQLAIILALQSVTLLKLSLLRHGKVLQIFSGLSALGAAGVGLHAIAVESPHAVLTASAVSAILLAEAWLFKAQRGWLNPVTFSLRTAGYAALSTALALVAVISGTDDPASILLLAGLALAGTASIYLLRLPEVVLGGQVLAAAAVGVWFVQSLNQPPLLSDLIVLGLGLTALMHWWQHQQIFPLSENWRRGWQTLHALAISALIGTWTFLHYSGSELMIVLGLEALGLLAYAFATRAWPLAVCSQLFNLATACTLVIATVGHATWPTLLGGLALIAAQSLLLTLGKNRVPKDAAKSLQQYNTLLRLGTVIMGTVIILNRVDAVWHFPLFANVAFVFFLLSLRRANAETLLYAAALLALGLISLVGRNLSGSPVSGFDLIGLLLILVAQQLGKRFLTGLDFFKQPAQGLLIILGLVGLWVVASRLVTGGQGGLLLTVTWSAYAFLAFGAGLVLRERLYRWIALGIVALSVGRLFVFDVWQFDTLSRILSFIVLGGVLLALGFLYNRFSHLFKKWM